nr:MAG TPA: DNA-directed RNA polymerase III subunit [Caudoviricetes sp.]DAR50918.1 MAG TPA: DNA-directed RNA polymerase III subunit [Caudoviricetes sp.]
MIAFCPPCKSVFIARTFCTYPNKHPSDASDFETF